MPPLTKNLGLIRAIHVGINPPINIKMIWYNNAPSVNRHFYYDTVTLEWKPFLNIASIVAGDNIVIDGSDPQNLIISAINTAPYKSFLAQLNGYLEIPTWTVWKNDINTISEPYIVRISAGVYKLKTSDGIVPGISDFPVGYRSFVASGSLSDGVSPIVVVPNLLTDTDNEFTFMVYDASTNTLTNDFVLNLEVRTFPTPPPVMGD